MKYQFSVRVYDDQYSEGETTVTKEIHAESYEDACFQGRSIILKEIPSLAHRGILPDTVLVNSRFDLEKVSED